MFETIKAQTGFHIRLLHLYVSQTAHVWVQVVVDPLASSWQSNSSDEQNQKSHIGERGCKVGHLAEKSTQLDKQGSFLEVSSPKQNYGPFTFPEDWTPFQMLK